MIPVSNPPPFRFGRQVARATAVLAAGLLAVTVVSAVRSASNASAAGINAGALQVRAAGGATPLNSGGSGTQFELAPPQGAACTGDSANGGYRVQSFMVPAAVDPSTLTYDANGPIPAGFGANFREPLFSDVGGSPFVQETTAVATVPGGGGLLVGLPAFSFAVFAPNGPTLVSPGTYNLGFACTLGNPSATQLDKFWTVQMTISADPTDTPAGLTWIVGTPPPPPTTTTTVPPTTTTTTTVPPTTTTTTTTVPPTTTTTTTVPPTTTTTTTVPPTTTSTTTTVPGATTTTVEDADEDENENECEPRHNGHHSHPHSEECAPPRQHGHPSNNSGSTTRLWRS
jgi:hypothetical protein